MPPKLNLILSPPTVPRQNMVLDEALFKAALDGEGEPTLRIYSWEPPGISLGHFQPLEMVDAAACDRHGVTVVRRVTGGGAVFHWGDVTACLVISASLLPKGVRDSYRLLSEAHARAIAVFGIAAHVGEQATPLPRKLRPGYDCFARLTECDVGVGGVKIAGSAQRRKEGVILHHTSIVFEPQLAGLLGELLPGAAAIGKPLSLRELAPQIDREDFVQRLGEEVAASLGLEIA